MCTLNYRFKVVLSAYLALNAFIPGLNAACDEGWYEVPGHGCFYFNSLENFSWGDANVHCQDYEGHLAEIEDEDTE